MVQLGQGAPFELESICGQYSGRRREVQGRPASQILVRRLRRTGQAVVRQPGDADPRDARAFFHNLMQL